MSALGSFTATERTLLHWLGHFYLVHGQPKRALVMLMLAARETGNRDRAVLTALLLALVANGMAERAAEMLPWLTDLPGPQHSATHLVRARVLWSVGRREEAKREFRLFCAKRRLARQARVEAA